MIGRYLVCWKDHPISLRHHTPTPQSPEIAAWGAACLSATSPYRLVGDLLYDSLHTLNWNDLYHPEGKPALSPVLLSLVCIFQHYERLSDRAAVRAVCTRLDWKYALHLPLHDAGFDASVLCEFRQRMLIHGAETWVFDHILSVMDEHGLFRTRGRQRTDSTHVLAAVRGLQRLETVGETLRLAVDDLTCCAPDWLQEYVQPQWGNRYATRFTDGRLPESQRARDALALDIGHDGRMILTAIDHPSTPPYLAVLPSILCLRQVWEQQYADRDGTLHWRDPRDLPAASDAINTPHDPDARYSSKRSTIWVGYRLHLTESCDDDLPRLITNVELTPAPVPDTVMTATIHAHLQAATRLPTEHLVDAGYIDAEHLVESKHRYHVDLVGPVPIDPSWQARAGQGFGAADFQIDWEHQVARCPEGQESSIWRWESDDGGNPTTHIEFKGSQCQPCPSKTLCTRSKRRGRQLNIRRQEAYHALKAARERQATTQFARVYAHRSGIEGTISYGVRVYGMRKSRYCGRAKTHFQEIMGATAINIVRASIWTPHLSGSDHNASVSPCVWLNNTS